MENKITRLYGVLGLAGPGLFFLGVFLENWILIVAGGVIMTMLDLSAMLLGALHPFFPILFAAVLGAIVNPWWHGVFWSLGIFHVLNIFNSIKKIRHGAEALHKA